MTAFSFQVPSRRRSGSRFNNSNKRSRRVGGSVVNWGLAPERAREDNRRAFNARILSMGKSATVCVIDDDQMVRRTMCNALDAAGFVTVEAEDGIEGLATIERSKARIAVID